ncbi:hypothetical protein GN157_08770 [Flavobacterium rakeshii]|uniref:Uncharacterized protein n=1 Tax=Flavobacterium rakeshii TaxID=1038845 RepID=A0A6N8HAX4_9FLAO|nr:hypothetical protein [Flavobacterium rakeshii]MUV03799.1 hypothetical protein [Flavobacterium rakeshii]
MKEEITLQLETSNGKSKEYNFEVDNVVLQNAQILLSSPITVIKHGGKGLLKSILVLIIIAIINISFFLYSLINVAEGKAYTPILVLLLGLIFTCWYTYKAYNYIYINVTREAIKGLTPILKKICGIAVDVVSTNANNDETKLAKAHVNATEIVNKINNLPYLVKKILIFLFNRIPFSGIINEAWDVINSGDNEKATDVVYGKLSSFANNKIFNKNKFNWILWYIPLNIIVLVVLIKLL